MVGRATEAPLGRAPAARVRRGAPQEVETRVPPQRVAVAGTRRWRGLVSQVPGEQCKAGQSECESPTLSLGRTGQGGRGRGHRRQGLRVLAEGQTS